MHYIFDYIVSTINLKHYINHNKKYEKTTFIVNEAKIVVVRKGDLTAL